MKIVISMSEMSIDGFIDSIEKAFKKQFPKGWIKGKHETRISEAVSFVFGVQPQEKHYNKITQNDPALHTLLFFQVKDGKLADKIKTEMTLGGKILVKPAEGSYNVYDNLKLGWRSKTDTPEKIVKHMENYFKKMRKVIDENRDKLKHDID